MNLSWKYNAFILSNDSDFLFINTRGIVFFDNLALDKSRNIFKVEYLILKYYNSNMLSDALKLPYYLYPYFIYCLQNDIAACPFSTIRKLFPNQRSKFYLML